VIPLIFEHLVTGARPEILPRLPPSKRLLDRGRRLVFPLVLAATSLGQLELAECATTLRAAPVFERAQLHLQLCLPLHFGQLVAFNLVTVGDRFFNLLDVAQLLPNFQEVLLGERQGSPNDVARVG